MSSTIEISIYRRCIELAENNEIEAALEISNSIDMDAIRDDLELKISQIVRKKMEDISFLTLAEVDDLATLAWKIPVFAEKIIAINELMLKILFCLPNEIAIPKSIEIARMSGNEDEISIGLSKLCILLIDEDLEEASGLAETISDRVLRNQTLAEIQSAIEKKKK
jgi:hypothetical protein